MDPPKKSRLRNKMEFSFWTSPRWLVHYCRDMWQWLRHTSAHMKAGVAVGCKAACRISSNAVHADTASYEIWKRRASWGIGERRGVERLPAKACRANDVLSLFKVGRASWLWVVSATKTNIQGHKFKDMVTVYCELSLTVLCDAAKGDLSIKIS